MDIYNVASIHRIKINKKNCTISFNPAFFILLIVKSFEILPKLSE